MIVCLLAGLRIVQYGPVASLDLATTNIAIRVREYM